MSSQQVAKSSRQTPQNGEKKALCAICGAGLPSKQKMEIEGAQVEGGENNKSAKNDAEKKGLYKLYHCRDCKTLQLFPLPGQNELNLLYQEGYFKKRSDRGYNNYLAEKVEQSIIATVEKNLYDLGFFEWEKSVLERQHQPFELKADKKGAARKNLKPKALEVGCAAGHFLKYMEGRGWEITGVDIAKEMLLSASKRGLHVVEANFLDYMPAGQGGKYDLIVMWATLEHLPNPVDYFQKAQSLLKPGGRFIVSTAHYSFWAKIYGKNWRYLNIPEHLFFFTTKALGKMGQEAGMNLERYITYGSGFTHQAGKSPLFYWAKWLADGSAKMGASGDMIAAQFINPD